MAGEDRLAGAARTLEVDAVEIAQLVAGDHSEPHRILGAHAGSANGEDGVWVRAFLPDAARAACVLEDGAEIPLEAVGGSGLFGAFLAGRSVPLPYRLKVGFLGGAETVVEDPYRFPPTLGDVDLHLFHEGTHRRIWECLGARRRTVEGVEGVSFAVWAPNARRVSVVGDFCRWDGRLHPMRRLGGSGVFELFLPGLAVGSLYKYEIKTREGALRLKADPVGRLMEVPPSTASRVWESSYEWGDQDWIERRAASDPPREPMAIYEVHLGSWIRVPEEGDRSTRYREIAPVLVAHVKRFGFTHIQLMPVAEHPFSGSWGYQVSGYFAPTSRYGSPDDFKFFVDTCHRNGIGVIVDWVPAHFPRDDFALRRFDGTALYEHDDPRLGEHPDWGTLIFNYGRSEVRGFLIANALFWLEEYHVDALRVDAVASMLYLDYSRKEGEWIPNRFGGRENLDAIDLLREVNEAIRTERPGCYAIAEESTSWPYVTRPVAEGGLGFAFKWNMGWMHDTLDYFKNDPIHRRHHQNRLTFAMLYEYSERFIMPLSHDEVVHLKGSLLGKMPGDAWQKLANLRLLLAYQYTRPGKKLLFMGTELAPYREWTEDTSLDWHLASEPSRVAFANFLADLGTLYAGTSALWRADHEPAGFSWIDCSDAESSILSYVRRDGDRQVVVVLNLTPVPRESYRIGAPLPGTWVKRLDSDDPAYGGSGFDPARSANAEAVPYHGLPQSLVLRLPPLAALVFEPKPKPARKKKATPSGASGRSAPTRRGTSRSARR
jgi:1,4-alpha-glucan branching enzyme